MPNPYTPPGGIHDYPSFRSRVRRALARARREYRAGLLRDNISRSQHIRAWLSLLALGFVCLIVGIVVCFVVLVEFGVIKWRLR